MKVALRTMARHKSFTLINFAGLTLGLTACFLIGLYVRDEMRFDKFIPDNQDVYRIYYEVTDKEGTSKVATTPPVFASVLQQHPEVNKTTRFLNHSAKELFEAGGKKLYQGNGIFADTGFFELFPLQLVFGSFKNVLNDPSSIMISEEMSQKFFGKENPVGKEIQLDKDLFNIKGVFRNTLQFHLPVEYIIPLSAAGIPADRLQDWGWYGFYNYIRVNKGTDIKLLEKKFQAEAKPFLKGSSSFIPLFQPLREIHLHSSDFKYDMAEKGDIGYVKALSIIAIFILLIACFNFVNLATAKSLQRAKEVGVRKSIGASRLQLVTQFVGETVLLSLICIIISVLLTFILLPFLNNFTGKHIVFNLFTDPAIGVSLISLGLLVGILSGFYPALILSRFKPTDVLKSNAIGNLHPGRIPWLRHGLVVIQFSISILLIISSIVVLTQVNYLHNKELGFNKEQIIFFSMKGSKMKKEHDAFRNRLIRIPGVSSVSVGYGFPGDQFGNGDIKTVVNGEERTIFANYLMTDYDYIKTLGFQLISGRDFSKQISTDKDEAYIINETAAKELGFGTPQKALGQKLLWNTWAKFDSIKTGLVIGVVKDFHYKSLYDKIEPAVMQIYPAAYSKVAVKINTSDAKNIIGGITSIWNQYSPDYPIEYNFLDENFRQMYVKDDKLKSMLWIFTAITVLISCLGLFGLAAYSAERRKKEIGIRKVLGASAKGLIMLLSKEFIRLSLLAFIIASPIAWYFMNSWLQDFAYRINITWYVFAITGVIAVGISLMTVSFQAIKAAFANPIKSLRTE
jgi:putative ABC transport system permease protein